MTKHTLFIANDNDFLGTIADPLKLPNDATRGMIPNPNQFYVFAFDDADLPTFVPQQIREVGLQRCDGDRGGWGEFKDAQH